MAAERKKVMTEAVNENDIIVIKNLVKVRWSKLYSKSVKKSPQTTVC